LAALVVLRATVPRYATTLVLVLTTGLTWGLLGPANKVMFAGEPRAFDGTTLAVARAVWSLPFFLAGAALFWRIARPRLQTRGWLAVIGAGIVFGPGVSLVFSVAAQHTSVAHISFLVGVSPVTNTALAALVFRTGLDRRGRVALALGVLGVLLLAVTQRSDAAGLFGDAMMVLWLLAFAAYACLLRAVGAALDARLLMCLVGSIALLALVVPALVLGYGGAVTHVADTPLLGGWFFGEIVIGAMIVGQTTYAAAVRRLGVAMATIGSEYFALAVGVAASLAMHERWNPLTVVAGAIFCCALAATFAPIPALDEPHNLRSAA
jgi:drug/metabolite transporter (DMT)-like permease